MDFAPSPRTEDLLARLREFMAEHIAPIEAQYHADVAARENTDAAWEPLPILEELRAKARSAGLWNLFLPAGAGDDYAKRYGTAGGRGLTNVEYAPLAEEMGRSLMASYVFNCNAPDTGNMEVLLHYGDDAQRQQWLEPLLAGEIRSAFAMTEPAVASSDPTNLQATAVLDDDEVVINGRKWWTTGVGHPDCQVLVFMGLTDPDADKHLRHSMVLVPRDAEGVTVERMLHATARLDEPYGHGEVSFTDVRVPASNILTGPGRAFEIAQGRLGPGRVHHCMRLIGLAEAALESACTRALDRHAFGRTLADLGGNKERIAKARIAIDAARLLVLNAAWKLDTYGARGALSEVSQIKAHVPLMAEEVIDFAMQIHGGAGVSEDFPLAAAWTTARAIRIADGADEVHLDRVGRLELRKYARHAPRREGAHS